MSYAVKEMFLTLQGEGVNAGPPRGVRALRRLQSLVGARGGSRDARSASFCDTDFVGTDGAGGGRFADAAALAAAAAAFWGEGQRRSASSS